MSSDDAGGKPRRAYSSAPMTPVARSPRGRANRREDMLAAAGRLFAEQGYHGTSMRQIADASGVRAAALYNHFAGKEQLLAELGRRYFEVAIPQLEAAAHGPGDAASRLVALTRESVEVGLAMKHEHLALINDLKHIRRSPGLHRLMTDRERCIALWREVLAQGRKDGSIRTDLDPDSVIWIIFTAITGVIDDSFQADFGGVHGAVPTDTLASVVVDGVRNRSRGRKRTPAKSKSKSKSKSAARQATATAKRR